MGNIINAWNSALGAADVVTSGIEYGLEKQAKLDLNARQLKLQEDINKKLNDFNTRSDYENWQEEVDELFSNTAAEMSDRNSEYYCRNNLTASMFDEVLQNARVQTQQKTALVVQQYQSKSNWANHEKTINRIFEMYSGQDAFDQAVQELKDLRNVESINDMEAEDLTVQYWQRAVKGVYEDSFEQVKKSAFAAGKTADEVWDDLDRTCKDRVTRKNEYGVAIPNYGTGEYRSGLEKSFKQQYNAEQATYQRTNVESFSNDIVSKRGDIMDMITGASNAKSAATIVSEINEAHDNLKKTQSGQLGNGEKDRLSKEYKSLLDLMEAWEKSVNKGGSSDKSANAPSFGSVMLTKGFTDSYLMMIEDGTFSDNYAAANDMKEVLGDAWFNNDWKEQKIVENGIERNMTFEEKVEYFNNHYKLSPAYELLNSNVLKKKLENNYPSLYIKYQNIIKDIEKDIKDNPNPKKRKYTEGAATHMSNFIDDAMAGAGRDTNTANLEKLLDVQLNAVTLDGVNELFKTKKKLESQDKYLARTANELRDNDILITDDFRNTMKFAPGTEEKVKAIAQDQKNYIASNLGVELNEDWDYVAVTNDRKPIPVFTDDKDNKYMVQATANGKTVEIVNEKGDVYKQLSKAERKDEYKTDLAVSYGNMAAGKEKINSIADKEEQNVNTILRNSNNMPTLIKHFAKTDSDSWNSEAGAMLNRDEAFKKTAKKIDNLAKDKNYSDSDFKNLTGKTKEEWKAIKSLSEKYKIISQS